MTPARLAEVRAHAEGTLNSDLIECLDYIVRLQSCLHSYMKNDPAPNYNINQANLGRYNMAAFVMDGGEE